MEMESILASVKKMLDIHEQDTNFDPDIIMHVNSVFSDLQQLGVGPDEGFMIEDESSTWGDFMADAIKLQSVKSYIYLKVKLLFDNSTLSSTVIGAMERQIEKYEWRLNVAAESIREEEIENG